MTRVRIQADEEPSRGPEAMAEYRAGAGPNQTPNEAAPWDVRAAVVVWSLVRAPVWYLWHLDSLYARVRLNWLPKAWGFVMAHRGGWYLFGREPKRRAAICGPCAQRVQLTIGEYCNAQIMGCGCPVKKRWVFSKLPYLRRLRSWTCPIGAFDRKEAERNGH